MKENYLTNVGATIKRFSDFLGEKKWIIGNMVY